MTMTDEREAPKKAHLTAKTITQFPAEETRVQIYDAQTVGFGLRIEPSPSGRRSFFWCRKIQGRPVFKSIGAVEDCPVAKARETAMEWNGKLSEWKRHKFEGENPFQTARGEMTFGGLVDLYVEKQIRTFATHPDRAAANVTWMVDKYLADWKGRKLTAIHDKDVRDRHRTIGERTRSMANRVVQLVRRIYFWGIKRERIFKGENPAIGISYFSETKCERFLNGEELTRLFTALKHEPNRDLRDFVLLSLFCGARKSDVLAMAWVDLSLDDNTWRIPLPKGGKPYLLPLIPEAVDLLQKRKKHAKGPYVFHSARADGHLLDFRQPWYDLLERAEITDFTIHSLRRTYASWQAGLGASLPIIGKSLGHKPGSVATSIYARLDLAPVRQSISNAVSAMLAQGKGAGQKLLYGKRAITPPKED